MGVETKRALLLSRPSQLSETSIKTRLTPPLSTVGETEAQSGETSVAIARLQTLVLAQCSPDHNHSLLNQM